MTSMMPDWTSVASGCASAPQLERIKRWHNQPELRLPLTGRSWTWFQERPCCVAETPHSKALQTIDCMPGNRTIYRLYGIWLAQ